MPNSVGLDIGKEWIKVVEVSPDRKLVKIGREKIVNKDSEDKVLYVKRITSLFKRLNLSKNNVVVNLRGSFIVARTYLPPSADKDAFEHWFVESIESIIPGTPIEDVIYSYELLPSGRALIAFARRQEVYKQLKMLEACKIHPISIDASCLALYDSFASHPWVKAKQNIAVLDIGNSSTSVLIIREGEAFSSNSINYDDINLLRNKERSNKLSNYLNDELKKIFMFYQEKDDFKVPNIIITGDHSIIRGLRKNLAAQMHCKVEIGNAFALLKRQLPDNHNRRENPIYGQTLGLALKGLTKKGIDLMPYETKEMRRASQKQKKFKDFARISVFSAAFICMIMAILLLFMSQYKNRLSKQLTALANEKSSLEFVNVEQKLLTDKLTILKQLSLTRIPWSKVLYDLGSCVPEGLYFDEISTYSRLVAHEQTAERNTRVVIQGSATSQKVAMNFIKQLEANFNDIVIENMSGDNKCVFKISLGL